MNELITMLKKWQANSVVFYSTAHGFHWNVEGNDFPEWHSKFDEIYSDVYESTDAIVQKKSDQISEKIVSKYYEVEIIKTLNIADVPYILASMKTNQAFSRNTFTMIDEKKYGGNIAAIKSLIGELNDFKIDPLKTLSSVQLETLVVKIFEKNGAFIAAWRGGTLKGIDIIAKFEGNIPDNLLIKKIQKKDKDINIDINIQVKIGRAHV